VVHVPCGTKPVSDNVIYGRMPAFALRNLAMGLSPLTL
jgi:hypothetical protein